MGLTMQIETGHHLCKPFGCLAGDIIHAEGNCCLCGVCRTLRESVAQAKDDLCGICRLLRKFTDRA